MSRSNLLVEVPVEDNAQEFAKEDPPKREMASKDLQRQVEGSGQEGPSPSPNPLPNASREREDRILKVMEGAVLAVAEMPSDAKVFTELILVGTVSHVPMAFYGPGDASIKRVHDATRPGELCWTKDVGDFDNYRALVTGVAEGELFRDVFPHARVYPDITAWAADMSKLKATPAKFVSRDVLALMRGPFRVPPGIKVHDNGTAHGVNAIVDSIRAGAPVGTISPLVNEILTILEIWGDKNGDGISPRDNVMWGQVEAWGTHLSSVIMCSLNLDRSGVLELGLGIVAAEVIRSITTREEG
jgi:hypothetical protein